MNRPVDVGFLEVVGKLFVEVMAAPEFTPDALEWLANKKKNCRAVRIDDGTMPAVQLRTIRGGLLAQTNDRQFANPTEWRCVTERAVSDDEMRDAEFAWNAVRAIKSNAIVICRDQATVGVGAGQMNRLESAKIASKLAGEKAHGAVAASDAFFPFADGLRAVAEAGVSVIVQPGGSIRDDEVIAAANELGISLILTGIRHFKH